MYDGIHSAKKRKRNEIMPFPATWMELEIIRLRKKKEKDKYMISLIYGI